MAEKSDGKQEALNYISEATEASCDLEPVVWASICQRSHTCDV